MEELIEGSGLDPVDRLLWVISPSFAMSTAILSAAGVVRLPDRVCRIQSRLSCMVNSMSCMSR